MGGPLTPQHAPDVQAFIIIIAVAIVVAAFEVLARAKGYIPLIRILQFLTTFATTEATFVKFS